MDQFNGELDESLSRLLVSDIDGDHFIQGHDALDILDELNDTSIANVDSEYQVQEEIDYNEFEGTSQSLFVNASFQQQSPPSNVRQQKQSQSQRVFKPKKRVRFQRNLNLQSPDGQNICDQSTLKVNGDDQMDYENVDSWAAMAATSLHQSSINTGHTDVELDDMEDVEDHLRDRQELHLEMDQSLSRRKAKSSQSSNQPKLPPEGRHLLQRAQDFFLEGDYVQSRVYLHQLITQYPQCAEAFQQMGMIEEEEGSIEQAIRLYEIAATIKSSDTMLWKRLAYLYMEQGDDDMREKALSCLTKAIRSNGDDMELFMDRATIHEDMKKYKRALDNYRIVAENRPYDVELAVHMSRLYLMICEPQQAVDRLEQCFFLVSSFHRRELFRNMRLHSKLINNQPDKKKPKRVGSLNWIHIEALVDAYFEAGMYAKVSPLFKNAESVIKVKIDNLVPLIGKRLKAKRLIGLVCSKSVKSFQQQFESLIEDLSCQHQYSIRLHMSQVLSALKKPHDAIDVFKPVLNLTENDQNPYNTPSSWVILAEYYQAIGDNHAYEEALQYYDMSLCVYHYSKDIKLIMAELYDLLGQSINAQAIRQGALKNKAQVISVQQVKRNARFDQMSAMCQKLWTDLMASEDNTANVGDLIDPSDVQSQQQLQSSLPMTKIALRSLKKAGILKTNNNNNQNSRKRRSNRWKEGDKNAETKSKQSSVNAAEAFAQNAELMRQSAQKNQDTARQLAQWKAQQFDATLLQDITESVQFAEFEEFVNFFAKHKNLFNSKYAEDTVILNPDGTGRKQELYSGLSLQQWMQSFLNFLSVTVAVISAATRQCLTIDLQSLVSVALVVVSFLKPSDSVIHDQTLKTTFLEVSLYVQAIKYNCTIGTQKQSVGPATNLYMSKIVKMIRDLMDQCPQHSFPLSIHSYVISALPADIQSEYQRDNVFMRSLQRFCRDNNWNDPYMSCLLAGFNASNNFQVQALHRYCKTLDWYRANNGDLNQQASSIEDGNNCNSQLQSSSPQKNCKALILLNIALCLLHRSMQKNTGFNRHTLIANALAYMCDYADQRRLTWQSVYAQQEIEYNFGRFYLTLGLYRQAMGYFLRAIECVLPHSSRDRQVDDHHVKLDNRDERVSSPYDLKQEAIYAYTQCCYMSGQMEEARAILLANPIE
ncbi:hypothetical protein MP228_006425 [Amoeboaphelidium protococcarum]|nr:hypothetical protein MP228_006425 [Amoeboaphelidium protococcarum]